MTSRDFAFWLQGFFEITESSVLTEKQVNMVKAHLNLVFKHEIDPSMGNKEHQDELNDIHSQGHLTIKPSKFNYDQNILRC